MKGYLANKRPFGKYIGINIGIFLDAFTLLKLYLTDIVIFIKSKYRQKQRHF